MTPQSPAIRPATLADAALIVAIYNEGIRDRVATFESRERSVEDVMPWLEEERFPFLVAERDARVAGWIAASSQVAKVSAVSGDQDVCGGGYGSGVDECIFSGQVHVLRSGALHIWNFMHGGNESRETRCRNRTLASQVPLRLDDAIPGGDERDANVRSQHPQ